MSRAIRILARALTLAAISVPGAITASTAQRQIEVDAQHRSDAVLFTAVTVGNMDVQCGLVVSRSAIQTVTPFDAGDDWLQNTVLYLINRTNKTAVFGQIALWFPDTGSGSPSQPTTKECPECLSNIPINAKRCAFCTSEQPVKA